MFKIKSIWIVLFLIILFCCGTVAAEEGALPFPTVKLAMQGHLRDSQQVIGKSKVLDDIFKKVSRFMDTESKNAFMALFPEAEKGLSGWNHRIMGHVLDGGSIPSDSVEFIVKRTGLSKDVVLKRLVSYNKKALEKLAGEISSLYGIHKNHAKALVRINACTHLLGDWSTKATGGIPGLKRIISCYEKNLAKFVGPQKAKKVARQMRKVLLKYKGGDFKVLYTELKKVLVDSKVGEAVEKTIEEYVNKASISKGAVSVKSATVNGFRKRVKASGKGKTAVTKTGKDVTKETVEHTAKKTGVESKKALKGLMQRIYHKDGTEHYILSVHVPKNAVAGVSAGVLTFVISEGISLVGLAAGNITEEEFLVETGKNAGAALVEGMAVFVSCCLGFGPAGVVTVVIGVGAYMIYDFVFNILYDINKAKGITLDDYLGILPTSIQRRKGAFDYEGAGLAMLFTGSNQGLMYKGKSEGLDYKGKNYGLGEVSTKRESLYGL